MKQQGRLARRLVTYAHKLSYTTFAPPGFVPGQTPLRNFRPPAPQDWQLRASLLHQFAGALATLHSEPSIAARLRLFPHKHGVKDLLVSQPVQPRPQLPVTVTAAHIHKRV